MSILIQINNISLSLSHKICFEHFTTQINDGSRIAVMGRNGCGKTTLLNMLHGSIEPSNGDIHCADNIVRGMVPQVIENLNNLSGGQRFNKALTEAMCHSPDILLLDEPTNHLDHNNRKSLLRMLKSYRGALIIVSHDVELLRHAVDTLWHIDQGKIHLFSGKYDDYILETKRQRMSVEQALSRLDNEKMNLHHALMKEQQRGAKSKAKGQKSIHQRKWPTVVSAAKASRSQETAGRKQLAIEIKKQDLTEQLSTLRLPEIIVPTFSLSAAEMGNHVIVSVSDGNVGYINGDEILGEIYFSMRSKERIAILGDNGSGKSTFIKAILNHECVLKSGSWMIPKQSDIGYLDQHYATLSPTKTVYETIAELVSGWSQHEVRRHLNTFLFRKNPDVEARVNQLSGGEKARLSLAIIAALTPTLLILDEVTNNLDLETKQHVVEVLRQYPGAMIVISHDDDFLNEIGIGERYQIANGRLFVSA